MDILKIENLTKKYGKGTNEVIAVDDISFTVKKGEFLAIIGPSGSGKSTLLHLLGGVDKPTSGKVHLDNTDIYSLSENQLSILRRRKVGFVFQAYNLIPVLTAEENMLMPLLLDNRKGDSQYIEELMEMLSLKDRKKHLPSQLSGGQQQRVCIGRALANKPAIILADEPTGNLDSKSSKEVLALLKYTVKKYNQTLILISHDMNVAAMADRVITIMDGKISTNEVDS